MTKQLRPELRAWLVLVGFMSIIDNLTFAFNQDLRVSDFYAYANVVFPGGLVHTAFAFLAVSCFCGLRYHTPWVIRFALSFQVVIYGIFGLSVFRIVFHEGGSSAAVPGAFRWWGYAVVAGWHLSRPFFVVVFRIPEIESET